MGGMGGAGAKGAGTGCSGGDGSSGGKGGEGGAGAGGNSLVIAYTGAAAPEPGTGLKFDKPTQAGTSPGGNNGVADAMAELSASP